MKRNTSPYLPITRRLALKLGLAVSCAVSAPALADWHANPPLFEGEQRNYTPRITPTETPLHAFQDGTGELITVEAFRGRVVVLNFWATWCPPCVAEMPSLNALNAKYGGDDFEVVTLSLDNPPQSDDTEDPALAFLKKHNLDSLAFYRSTDPQKTYSDFRLGALPTTLVLDRTTATVGVLAGPADWNSPAAHRLVEFYLENAPPAG